jgi:hypothetical protein
MDMHFKNNSKFISGFLKVVVLSLILFSSVLAAAGLSAAEIPYDAEAINSGTPYAEGASNSVNYDPLYRFYNSITSGHFFTISESEKNYAIQNFSDFVYEGVGFYSFSNSQPGNLPVYRFYNTITSGHFFTISESEKSYVMQNFPDFVYEGVGFYAFSNSQPGNLPIYRFYNTITSGHFFTISESEKSYVIQNFPDFVYEGVGFYAFNNPVPTTGNIKVINGSTSSSIKELYIAPVSSPTWGVNQLSSNMSPGSILTITQVLPGKYDLKAVFTNGTTYKKYNFSVNAGSTVTVTPTTSLPTGNVKITNGYSRSLTKVYLKSSSSSSWGVDQASSNISPGSSLTITGVPGGRYDLKVVASNGAIGYKWSFLVVNGMTYNILFH